MFLLMAAMVVLNQDCSEFQAKFPAEKMTVAGAEEYFDGMNRGGNTCVTMKRLTEVSCFGTPSDDAWFKDGANRYGNPFGTEVGLFKTSTGGTMRVGGSWTIPHYRGELGRCWGTKGNFRNRFYGDPKLAEGVETRPVAFPKAFNNKNYHGGSHGYLTDDFLRAILLKRQPIVDVSLALNTTLSGVYAHQSAMRGGELLKIPLYDLV